MAAADVADHVGLCFQHHVLVDQAGARGCLPRGWGGAGSRAANVTWYSFCCGTFVQISKTLVRSPFVEGFAGFDIVRRGRNDAIDALEKAIHQWLIELSQES